jgi:ElaB/YqjD/DUF883 family membrane-anchored ribosome-binding protein
MADSLQDKAAAKINEAKQKASDATRTAKAKASEAGHSAKAKAESAAASARAKAKKAAESGKQSLDHNPLGVVMGGLAVGAIAAALLPRTKREDDLAGNVGRTVRSTASKAAKNARETAKEQLDALGVNADAAKGQFRDLMGKLGEAASTAGSAAADAIRKK